MMHLFENMRQQFNTGLWYEDLCCCYLCKDYLPDGWRGLLFTVSGNITWPGGGHNRPELDTTQAPSTHQHVCLHQGVKRFENYWWHHLSYCLVMECIRSRRIRLDPSCNLRRRSSKAKQEAHREHLHGTGGTEGDLSCIAGSSSWVASATGNPRTDSHIFFMTHETLRFQSNFDQIGNRRSSITPEEHLADIYPRLFETIVGYRNIACRRTWSAPGTGTARNPWAFHFQYPGWWHAFILQLLFRDLWDLATVRCCCCLARRRRRWTICTRTATIIIVLPQRTTTRFAILMRIVPGSLHNFLHVCAPLP